MTGQTSKDSPKTSEWTYKGKIFTEEMIGDSFGFVYLITCTLTGRKYIGKKFFSFSRTRKPLKGFKRKRRDRVKSDWETYFGSNRELNEDVVKHGSDKFTREILRLCASKSECTYWEAKYIFERDALIDPCYYNQWVSVKINMKHAKSFDSHNNQKKVPQKSYVQSPKNGV